MYYVIQCAPGKEEQTIQMITRIVDQSLYTTCFHLTRDLRKKIHGEWKTIHEKLLPCYIFIQTETPEQFHLETKRVPALTKFLGQEEGDFIPLKPNEAAWVDRLTGKGSQPSIPVSQIEIAEGDKVNILTEPLAGMQGYIKKINLHKRIAEVEVEILGRKTVLHLGVEFVQKTARDN